MLISGVMGQGQIVSESRHSLSVGTAILIGYWRYPEEFPDPVRFIDPTWASSERRLVADFLERCTSVNQYRGLSVCRFCARFNGSAEMTDGVYCWPEGLAHYVKRHLVRLPAEFVRHVHRAQNPLDKVPSPRRLVESRPDVPDCWDHPTPEGDAHIDSSSSAIRSSCPSDPARYCRTPCGLRQPIIVPVPAARIQIGS